MKEKAYAKINLHLDVVAKRMDDFHDLEMVMAPVALHDELTFKKLKEDRIKLITSKHITDNPEDNLVYKVASYVKDSYSIREGVEIYIEKNIPIAGGLAGGSADAAATLRALNKLFKLKLSLDQLAEIGEIFGADIPYCVYNQLCIARGKGEQLYFLKQKLNIPILLITPNIEVSTGKVFSHVDMNQMKPIKITTMSNAIYNKNYELIAKSLYNALEPITFSLFPEIEHLKDKVKKQDVDGVLMSGSGPSLLVMDKEKEKLTLLEKQFGNDHYVKLTKIK